MRVTEQGQIAAMELPEKWIEGPPHFAAQGIGSRSLREFHPPGEPEARLCFYYRGLPLPRPAASALRAVLDKPPHELGSKDLADLRELLQERSDPRVFKVSTARTEDLNGKRVLTLKGTYLEAGNELLQIFIDCDGTGYVVQEVYFLAPVASFSAHARAARQAIRSIEWKVAHSV